MPINKDITSDKLYKRIDITDKATTKINDHSMQNKIILEIQVEKI